MPFVPIGHIQNKIRHSFIFRLHVHGITEVLFGMGGGGGGVRVIPKSEFQIKSVCILRS